MFVKTNNKNEIISYPYSLEDFKKENKTNSLPKTLNNLYLEKHYVFPVIDAPKPEHDSIKQLLIRDTAPFKDVDEKWKIGWVVIDRTPEQIESIIEINKRKLNDLINKERDRRISGGFKWNGHNFQSDSKSYDNIMGASSSAIAAIVTGKNPDDVYWADPEIPFTWLTLDNSFVEMSPKNVIEFNKAAIDHKSKHFIAARTLKNMEIIPEDFTDDKWWQ